jgi:hypothetical protein
MAGTGLRVNVIALIVRVSISASRSQAPVLQGPPLEAMQLSWSVAVTLCVGFFA